MKVNLKQLDAFRAVIIAGSTNEAASLLNISQPAVSRSIQNLESFINYKLFIRQNGRLYPTKEAEYLYHEIDQLYSSIDHITNVMENIHLVGSGHLRIVASTPMGQRFLPDALAEFQSKRPDVKTSVRIVVKREMNKWLESQQFDVAIVSFPVDYPSSQLRHLASVEGVCILPIGHQLGEKPVINAEDLANENFISIVPDTILRARVDNTFNELGLDRSNMMVETQSGASICQMVASGLGVSIVDPFTASAFDSNKIVIRPFKPVIKFDFGVLLPMHKPSLKLADEFVELLEYKAKVFIEKKL